MSTDAHSLDRDHPNPFDGPLYRQNSAYGGPEGARAPGVHPPDLTQRVHDTFRETVLSEAFSCVGAKAAVRRGGYRIGVYRALTSPEATAGLARDLCSFVREQPHIDAPFTTFAAAFIGPTIAGERLFEAALWQQLEMLHTEDRPHHAWDPAVSTDPDSNAFSFSFAGRAFFVVGLHAAASRRSRRFPWPLIIFNSHEQFEHLRAEGKYDRMQAVIRVRERALQGNINPMLSDFGRRSEARQYGGRAVEEDWRCPFHGIDQL